MAINMKNLPEPEASFLRVTLVYKERSIPILCDVSDFLDCDSAECALELFDSYIQRYIGVTEGNILLIENIKGGKIFVYKVNDDTVCLCIHKANIDCINICKNYRR